MDKNDDFDPMPGIRTVLLTGFFSGNVCGLLYLTISGYLLTSLLLNPLALLGAFVGIGLLGMMVGALTGLSLRLLLGEQEAEEDWRAPVFFAGLASSVAGSSIAYVLVAMVFQMDR